MPDKHPAREGFMRNRGRCPGALRGTTQRVYVILGNGTRPKESWPADTGRASENTNWSLKDHPAAIVWWKPAEPQEPMPPACDVRTPEGQAFLESIAPDRINVYLDGELVKHAIAYDCDAGVVTVQAHDQDGKPIIETVDGIRQIALEERTGVVAASRRRGDDE